MLKERIKLILLGFCFSLNVCFGAPALLYGVVKGEIVNQNFGKKEASVMQHALGRSVEVKVFPSYASELRAIKKNPNLLTFSYAKRVFVPELSKMPNWQKLVKVLTVDPENNKVSDTYKAYIVTLKKSNINSLHDLSNKTLVYFNPESTSNYIATKKLLSDNKITNVEWVKAKNVRQAFTIVEKGEAHALGVWSELYEPYNRGQRKFKIIQTITIKNPEIFVNKNNLTPNEIQKIKKGLQHAGIE